MVLFFRSPLLQIEPDNLFDLPRRSQSLLKRPVIQIQRGVIDRIWSWILASFCPKPDMTRDDWIRQKWAEEEEEWRGCGWLWGMIDGEERGKKMQMGKEKKTKTNKTGTSQVR